MPNILELHALTKHFPGVVAIDHVELEDRKRQGLILDMPCYVNITLTDLAQVSSGGLLQNRTVYGRLIYAIGNNKEALRLSGHDPSIMKVIAFTYAT